MLQDGNSTSLLEWMNERFYATPFLIMTNYGQVENAVEAMQLGAANYLCKPVQPDKLLEAIGKIFGVTRERIRQIEQKAINKLRKTVKRKNIERENI